MKERLTNDQLILLLQSAYDEEKEIRNALRSTMNTYITILIAVLGGVLTIASFTSQKPIFCSALCIAGIVEIFVSVVAYMHYRSDYQRQVEAIVEQAKIEQVLGLTDEEFYQLNDYWKGEALIHENFLRARRKFETSSEFTDWFMKNTDVKIARCLYMCFTAIGTAIVIIGFLSVFLL